MKVKAPARTRQIEVTDEKENALAIMKDLAYGFYVENKKANEHAKAAKKARAALLAKMKDAKLTKKVFSFAKRENEAAFSLEAVVETPKSDKANVQKLFKILGDQELFLKIVSASKGAIVEFCGEAVFTQVKEEVEGEENVSVSLVK